MTERILFWHRRDLRLSDNVGLSLACDRSQQVIGVFCLDPHILEREDVSPARIVFLLESLVELQTQYASHGGQLLILHEPPVQGLLKLAEELSVSVVYWNADVEPYGRDRDRQVKAALKDKGIEAQAIWDQLLHAPGKILSGAGTPYTVYTPFWKNWRWQPKADPVPTPQTLYQLSADELAGISGAIALPSAQDLGVAWDNGMQIPVGEAAALEQLEAFCHASSITGYDEQRNYPAQSGTSLLSAALKFGTIGIRTVWAATLDVLERCRSDEEKKGVETWQKELAWREFYQHVMFAFPELAEGPYRPALKNFPWSDDRDRFEAWCQGMTGYPIVDAAMRQLNATGWMHNRCRMIVASFLTKDLILNWQWGEQYFMQTLCDGDLSANNGGWQWSASSGMDPKPLRIFNPASQAKKFDPEAEYIRTWLPELKSVDTGLLVNGTIPDLMRSHYDYPTPIVDHKVQQNTFKSLYKQQKEAIA